MHYIVPVSDGRLDIDYSYLLQGVQTSATECYVHLRKGAEARPTWQAITEDEFSLVKENLLNPA